MNTYWDLNEEDRGNLTESEVGKFVDAELMLKGVLKVTPLEFVAVPDMPAPSVHVHVVRCGKNRYEEIQVAFATDEQALAFAALRPMAIRQAYINGDYVHYVETIDAPEIIQTHHYTAAEAVALRADFERATAAKATNAKRTEAWNDATRKQSDALKGLWEDWHLCREKAAKLRQIRATFDEYKRIAGADDIAATFLAKVYSPAEIGEALPVLSADRVADE